MSRRPSRSLPAPAPAPIDGRRTRAVRAILMAVPAIVVAAAIRVVRPVVHVRLGRIRAERIGHLAVEPELYLCDRDEERPRRRLDRFYFSLPVANEELGALWSKVLPVSDFAREVDRFNRMVPGWERHTVPWTALDVQGRFFRTPPHLTLDAEDHVRGRRDLEALGIDPEVPRVCLANRDAAYLSAALPGRDWSYHRHRDASIGNYGEAALALAERGYYVLRMGSVVAEPFKVDHDRVIDYTDHRTPFLDVYLFATCAFALSTTHGLGALAPVLRRPVLFVNVASLSEVTDPPFGDVFVPKLVRRSSDGAVIGVRELVEQGIAAFTEASEFDAAGVEAMENTPADLAAAAVEFEQRQRGAWHDTPEDEERQAAFWRLLGIDDWCSHPNRIASTFLRSHPELLL